MRYGNRNDPSIKVEDTTFKIVRDNQAGRDGWAVLVKNPSIHQAGFLNCVELDTEPYNEYADFDGSGINMFRLLPEYTGDLLRTRRKIPRIFGVVNSSLDRRLRAEGIGQRMYAILLRFLSKKGAGLVPNSAYEGANATSTAAQRVWHRLSGFGVKTYGPIAWGGGVDSNVETVPPGRRRRGFPKEKGYRRQDSKSELRKERLSSRILQLSNSVDAEPTCKNEV